MEAERGRVGVGRGAMWGRSQMVIQAAEGSRSANEFLHDEDHVSRHGGEDSPIEHAESSRTRGTKTWSTSTRRTRPETARNALLRPRINALSARGLVEPAGGEKKRAKRATGKRATRRAGPTRDSAPMVGQRAGGRGGMVVEVWWETVAALSLCCARRRARGGGRTDRVQSNQRIIASIQVEGPNSTSSGRHTPSHICLLELRAAIVPSIVLLTSSL